jgi:Na+/melibiose symporter-like transporter
VAAWWFRVPALLLLIFFSFSFTMIQIVFESRLQHAIESESRATVSSFSGFLTEIGALTVFFSFGWMAQYSSYQVGFLIFGGIITLVGMVYWLGAFKSKKENDKPLNPEQSNFK